jgi:type II secretory pathway component PulC
VAPVAQNPPGTLKRSEVVSFLDAGFGRFLQRVEVEPNLDQGRFRGWNIVDLRPNTFWQGVDLRPGDTVVQVNGLPIEREMQAFEAFESLRTAEELTVSYYRASKPRALTYRILD